MRVSRERRSQKNAERHGKRWRPSELRHRVRDGFDLRDLHPRVNDQKDARSPGEDVELGLNDATISTPNTADRSDDRDELSDAFPCPPPRSFP